MLISFEDRQIFYITFLKPKLFSEGFRFLTEYLIRTVAFVLKEPGSEKHGTQKSKVGWWGDLNATQRGYGTIYIWPPIFVGDLLEMIVSVSLICN
jgi:hypothetical protein